MKIKLVAGSDIYPSKDNITNDDTDSWKMSHFFYTFKMSNVSLELYNKFLHNKDFLFYDVNTSFVEDLSGEFVWPPAHFHSDISPGLILSDAHHQSLTLYQEIFEKLNDGGMSVEEARYVARYALPLSHSTDFLVTGSLASWLRFIEAHVPLTHGKSAHPGMHQLACTVLYRLCQMIPNSVSHLWSQYQDLVLSGLTTSHQERV